MQKEIKDGDEHVLSRITNTRYKNIRTKNI